MVLEAALREEIEVGPDFQKAIKYLLFLQRQINSPHLRLS